jgi:hypothetical protein
MDNRVRIDLFQGEVRKMNIRKTALVLAVVGLAAALTGLGFSAEEGMYPISMLSRLDLRSKGLAISPEEIFAPDRPSLIFAVVSVGATALLSELGIK